MDDLQRLVLAALLHDLPLLMPEQDASPSLRRIFALASLDDPAHQAIVRLAESYTVADDSTSPLVQTPLRSIFSRVSLRFDPPQSFRPLAALPAAHEDQDALFPLETVDASQRAVYLDAMFAALEQLADTVDLDRFDHAYSHILAWLQRFGWCLPAHSDDVSLFDHARLTSAIAACLFLYHSDDMRVEAIEAAADAKRFCLLVGDLSGIQSYIFDIASIGPGGVARRLRARSFWLATLAETLSHYATDFFKVPLGNVIMASGGKFYLLVANDGETESRVAQLRIAIDRELHREFNGEIGINLACIPFEGARFRATTAEHQGFGRLVGDLNRMLGREKRRRGHAVLAGADGWSEDAFVFRSRHFEGSGACISCHKFPITTDDNLCNRCQIDVNLGRHLPRTRYVAYYKDDALGSDLPIILDRSIRLLREDELSDVGDPYLVTRLNNPQTEPLAALPGSFRAAATYIPVDAFGVAESFEEIADEAEGRPLLGYLKADVDYLGALFAHGLRRDTGANYDTATHIAALSRELDLFFSGWVQHTLSRTFEYRYFYTIFSGGDDLFLVGPWDKAAQLALSIYDTFRRFTGNNTDVSLSAGILFAKSHYPISRAAEDAETVLKRSKRQIWRDKTGSKQSRDQITLLDETVRWDKLPDILNDITTLRGHTQSLTSALLYDLIEYSKMYRSWKEQDQIEGLRYKAHFAYSIARNLRRGDAALYQWADQIIQSLSGTPESNTMRYLGLVATYLLFARRAGRSSSEREAQRR